MNDALPVAQVEQDDDVVLDRIVTVPNLISATRIALIPVFAWAFLTGSKDTFALILLIVIGCSDWVDGYVARKTGQVSKLGKLLDPVADRIAIFIVLIALTFRGVVAVPVAVALLGRDLIVSIVFPILESKGFPRLAVNQTGKWATALIFFGMGFAAGSVLETPVQEASGLLSQVLLIAGAVLYWIAGVFYVREIRKVIAARSAGAAV